MKGHTDDKAHWFYFRTLTMATTGKRNFSSLTTKPTLKSNLTEILRMPCTQVNLVDNDKLKIVLIQPQLVHIHILENIIFQNILSYVIFLKTSFFLIFWVSVCHILENIIFSEYFRSCLQHKWLVRHITTLLEQRDNCIWWQYLSGTVMA